MSISSSSTVQLIEEKQKLNSNLADTQATSVYRPVEVARSEERLSLAMSSLNDGLWDWNLETDEVYYSTGWKNIVGYAETELTAHLDTWIMLMHPGDKSRVLEEIKTCIDGCKTSFEIEYRMLHKHGHEIVVLSRAVLVNRETDSQPMRLVGTHVDITERKKAEIFSEKTAAILEMIAIGRAASEIYDAIALMYESRHPGLRCSMLELHENKLLHGGAPSLPQEYCEAVHGLEYGINVGSCGTATYTGKRVLVEDISTDPKWAKIKHVAMPHGMRCCWSEPIKSSFGEVLGAFGMYYNHPALPNESESKDLESAARLAGIVMERDHAQRRIWELAYKDDLTGLASRVHFYQRLNELIRRSSRHNHRFGLLYIDLDNFKDINDSLGHDTGDLLLKTIADRLKSTCRDSDYIARLSGDEFCILVEEAKGDYAANVAQRCLDAICQPLELGARKIKPGCSIGIAHFPDDGWDETSLTKAADTSLYVAKENGKNQFAFYTPKLTEQAEYRFQFEQYLREAIEQQQLSLVYQPQIDIRSGRIIGVEALSRWCHPQLGKVSPDEFIAAAEGIGMIKTLTEWVLRATCNQMVEWEKAGLPSIKMAINISPSHFLDKDLLPLVERIIEETGVTPTDLELEVTEGVVQTDKGNLAIFKQLKDLGIQLAIDDFGTGYSSFASLKHLTVDGLKIDKYFIDDILVDEEALFLVRSMIGIGQKLGYRITAEGVETHEQLATLKSLGCDRAQGYLFSKPLRQSDFLELGLKNFEQALFPTG